MLPKAPRADDLRASREWVRWKFGIKGEYGGALRQVDQSLDAIRTYEYSFLMSKVALLTCLERWSELTGLLKTLAKRYPNDVEVLYGVAEVFRAHGDWRSCLAVLNKAHPLIRASSDQSMRDLYYDTRVTCLYALGRSRQSVQEATRVLRRHPRLTGVRAVLRHIRAGQLKLDPWAPRSAAYLKELRRLAT